MKMIDLQKTAALAIAEAFRLSEIANRDAEIAKRASSRIIADHAAQRAANKVADRSQLAATAAMARAEAAVARLEAFKTAF